MCTLNTLFYKGFMGEMPTYLQHIKTKNSRRVCILFKRTLTKQTGKNLLLYQGIFYIKFDSCLNM
jgi:hypothetical protein